MKVAVLAAVAILMGGCAATWEEEMPSTAAGGRGLLVDGGSVPAHTGSLKARNGRGAVQPFGTSGEPAAYEYARGYRLGAGDRLTIRVLGQPDLTGDYIVDGAGAISMPLVNTVPVAGLTTADIERVIKQRLQGGFLRNPSVSAQVAIQRPFYILGEVNQAGSFPYQSGMTVQNAIAIAGGYSPRANQGEVLITRRLDNGTRTGKAAVTTQVFPGDVIYIRERWF